MKYTAGQAAKAAGVATATITRALKRGTISGTKGPDGAWQIEPAELHRVFPALAPQERERPFTQEHERPVQEAERAGEIRAMQDQLAALEDALADVREDRDQWRKMAERLALAPPERQPAQQPARSLWQRLLGR